MDVGAWLRALGLGQYETAFAENAVDGAVLPSLTGDDLKDIGVAAVGHRRKLLDAIAALREEAAPAPAPETPVAPAAERRQVAVLFCDLADSTALSARLDPEDLRALIGAYHRGVAAAIERQGGYVAKYLGDGVLAYLGWPAAREDDAERAVRAGLDAVQAVAALTGPDGQPLAARVGIATGEVVVGDPLGEGMAQERAVVGETPNRAARLQALAAPGAVLADAATRRLAGGLFAWEPLGPQAAKGFEGGVPAFRALGESGVESRFEALRSGAAAPMIGRAEELELLLRRWGRARAGEGQVVLLRGEAGIGKSRLTAALREAVASAGEAREELIFFCSPQHADSPLWPVAARLERAADLAAGDAPGARLAKLEALLAPLDPPAEDVALVAELLSVPTLGRWPASELSPQARRARLLAALARRVRALAARRPVLMVVEDAHWLDPTTRELLDLLVAEAPGMTLLLVATHRPEFDAAAWIGQAHVTPVQLNRLGRAEHAALLRRVAGGKALPPEVEATILVRTDGVPLFVEEVGRAVLEGGALREEAERWVLDGALPAVAVPATLQASLVARLDRLSSVRDVAHAGAVLGREFAHDLLAAVAGVPEPALRAALDALVAADLMQRRGAPPTATYTFKHALIRDAAHGTLLREKSRELHRLAAEAIERLRPDTAERAPEVLGHHRAKAGEAEVAAKLYRRAGERAAARGAFREARAHIASVLALLPDVKDHAVERRLEAGLRIALGYVAEADAGRASAEVGRELGRAVALCRGLGDDALLAEALWGLARHKLQAGDLVAALPLAEEGVAAARRDPVGCQLPLALAGLGVTHFFRGRLELARPAFEEVLAAPNAPEAGVGVLFGGLLSLSFLSRLLGAQGALDGSAALTRETLGRARRAGHTTALVNTLGLCSAQALDVRDLGALRDWAGELAALAEAHGYSFYAALARARLGVVAIAEGAIEDGVGLIAGAAAWFRASGSALGLPQWEAMLANASLLTGDTGAALGHIEGALRISARTGEAWFDAELHRCLGRVLLRLDAGEASRAEAELRNALEVARSQSALLFELRAARDLARLWRDQGRVAEARDLLAPVFARFTEGFGFPDLVEARALLAELGAEPLLAPAAPLSPASASEGAKETGSLLTGVASGRAPRPGTGYSPAT